MGKKAFILLIVLLLISSLFASDSFDDAKDEIWKAYVAKALADETLNLETEAKEMVFGNAKMRYWVTVKGEMPDNGYPLYIAMHGGGSSDTPDVNDEQWEMMKEYYSYSLDCGVYVAVRGVRDTWDTHFNPESYPLYDRLITYMILTENVDPNRVYLMGFSAGGDGVYAIGTRMADRFAALNMSSGHPNGVSLVNLANLPIQLQAGEDDTAFDRNTMTAKYGILLDTLAEKYPGLYIHRTLIHYGDGHNYDDYEPVPIPVMSNPRAWLEKGDRSHTSVNSYPPDWMENYTRNHLPNTVIWDLGTRAEMRSVTSFYWLRAPLTSKGTINASYSKNDNSVTIETYGLVGDFSILLNSDMVDLSKPVTFKVGGKTVTKKLSQDRKLLEETAAERGDPNYMFEAEVKYSDLIK